MFTHVLGGVAQGGLLFPRLSKPQRETANPEVGSHDAEATRRRTEESSAPRRRPGPCCWWQTTSPGSTSWRCTRYATAVSWPRPTSSAGRCIGTLATGGGTLYVKRESRRDAMRVVHRMARGIEGRGHPRRVPGRNHRRRQLGAAVSFQLDPGRDLRRRAGAAGGAADRRRPIRKTQPGVQATWVTNRSWDRSGVRSARETCAPWWRSARRNAPPVATVAHGRRTCVARLPRCGSRSARTFRTCGHCSQRALTAPAPRATVGPPGS